MRHMVSLSVVTAPQMRARTRRADTGDTWHCRRATPNKNTLIPRDHGSHTHRKYISKVQMAERDNNYPLGTTHPYNRHKATIEGASHTMGFTMRHMVSLSVVTAPQEKGRTRRTDTGDTRHCRHATPNIYTQIPREHGSRTHRKYTSQVQKKQR
jgi:hypothetical protein